MKNFTICITGPGRRKFIDLYVESKEDMSVEEFNHHISRYFSGYNGNHLLAVNPTGVMISNIIKDGVFVPVGATTVMHKYGATRGVN